MGHIVEREPEFTSTTDSSEQAIGVHIPRIRAWCFLPFSKALCKRIKNKEVHINCLEFLGILLAHIMVQEKYAEDPSLYAPTPVMCALCDNTSANAWWNKMSTSSTMGCNVLKLYAEYQRLSPVHSLTKHIRGVDNVISDMISRPDELFTPHLTHLYDTPYTTLITQVYRQFRAERRWNLFLPSPNLLSAMNSALSSTPSPGRPQKPTNNGHFVPAAHIFSNGRSNAKFTASCFL